MLAFLFLVGCLIAVAAIASVFVFALIGFMACRAVGSYKGIMVFAGCLILMLAAFISWGPAALVWAELSYRSLLGG